MASPSVWTCPDCGLPGHIAPDRLPDTEFAEEVLSALHQWARFFEHLNHDAWAEAHPEPPPTILDFVHYLLANQRLHDHRVGAGEPSRKGARVGRLQLLETMAG